MTTGCTTAGLPPRATSRRSSTGRSPRSAIRWPIWPTASTGGWRRPTRPPATRPARPRCPASASRKELLGRYSERTGADLSQIEYYSCFNHWKTVCILQGVYARYVHGQKDTEGVEIGLFPQRMDRSLQLAVEAAERLGR